MSDESDTSETKLESSLRAWSERWKLCEFEIECQACGAALKARYASHAFPHTTVCPSNSAVLEYPWHELRRLLQQLKTSNL